MKPKGVSWAACMQCDSWLAACAAHGWNKAGLALLERLWWKHHDKDGNLKPRKKAK